MTDASTTVFEYPIEIRQRDVDQFDRVTPGALYGFMQDAALAHSAARGLSGPEFFKLGYAWMLNRIHFKIDTPPKLLERLTIKTWGSDFSGLYAVREFHIVDPEGKIIVRGTSRWIIIDLKKKRVVRVPDFIEERYGVLDQRGLDAPFAKLRLDVQSKDQLEIQIRWSDLDSNCHANSARYFDWCVDTLPVEVLQQKRLTEFELEYKKELLLNDHVISASQSNSQAESDAREFHHRLSASADDALIAQARSCWI